MAAKSLKVINDRVVSYIDLYRTLADIIGSDLEENEAPDSVSLWWLIQVK